MAAEPRRAATCGRWRLPTRARPRRDGVATSGAARATLVDGAVSVEIGVRGADRRRARRSARAVRAGLGRLDPAGPPEPDRWRRTSTHLPPSASTDSTETALRPSSDRNRSMSRIGADTCIAAVQPRADEVVLAVGERDQVVAAPPSPSPRPAAARSPLRGTCAMSCTPASSTRAVKATSRSLDGAQHGTAGQMLGAGLVVDAVDAWRRVGRSRPGTA